VLEASLAGLGADAVAKAQRGATAAAEVLMLTDAPLLYPPAQLALSAMRAGFRKVGPSRTALAGAH
jgi:hypothetical protein